jgi:hypothetical protein
MKVFLGGTYANSKWREKLIPLLKIDFFNPVVSDWTPECQLEELKQRRTCDFVLYIITPAMEGAYSIAEAVDDSNKRPKRTVFCYLANDEDANAEFNKAQLKSLKAIGELVERNGGAVFRSIIDVAGYLNKGSGHTL